MIKKRPDAPSSSINVTPLIDILLVLLVIFIVITPIDSSGHETVVPQEPPPGIPATRNQSIVLRMDGGGAIRINQNTTDIAGVESQLRELFRTGADRTVFIQADTELLFNDVARLIDVVTGAGALKIGLLSADIVEKTF